MPKAQSSVDFTFEKETGIMFVIKYFYQVLIVPINSHLSITEIIRALIGQKSRQITLKEKVNQMILGRDFKLLLELW